MPTDIPIPKTNKITMTISSLLELLMVLGNFDKM